MKANVSTKTKTLSITGIVIASVLVVFAFCGRYFNSFFKHIANFFVGSFGMSFYGIMAAVIVFCSFTLAGKKVRIPAKYVANFVLLFVAVVLLVHTLTTTFLPNDDFGAYANYVYHYYQAVPTFGGIVFGSIAYAFQSILHLAGAIIVYVALLAFTVFMAGDFFYSYATGKLSLTRESVPETRPVQEAEEDKSQIVTPSLTPVAETRPESDFDQAMRILYPTTEQSVNPVQVTNVSPQQNFDVADRSTLDANGQNGGLSAEELLFPKEVLDRTRGTDRNTQKGSDNVGGNNGFFDGNGLERTNQNISAQPTISGGSYFTSGGDNRDNVTTQPWQTTPDSTPSYTPVQKTDSTPASASPAVTPTSTAPKQTQSSGWRIHQSAPVDNSSQPSESSNTSAGNVADTSREVANAQPAQSEQSNGYDNVQNTHADNDYGVTHAPSDAHESYSDVDIVDAVADNETPFEQTADVVPTEDDSPFADETDEQPAAQPVQTEVHSTTTPAAQPAATEEKPAEHHFAEYVKPPLELLAEPEPYVDDEAEERQAAADAIVRKLAVFNIKVELDSIIVGPAFSRYLFKVLSERTRMSDFAKYNDDLKGCIEAPDEIRILAPVPSTNLVGIEVANKHRTKVTMREMLESKEFAEAKGNLCFAIGKAINGKAIVKDLTKLTHLLIAGQTNSGKSVCVHSLIISMLYRYGPEYVRFLMVDPKIVELSRYNGLPHMLTTEAITEVNDALAGMDYLINEMEARYQLFKSSGVGDIAEYNRRIAGIGGKQRLPYLVFVCDELADLMSRNKAGFEGKLCRLAAKARAAGIHLVLATQRPDVKTVTGTIKSNLPARIALTTAVAADSITILGVGGAEKLLNYGDMLVSDPAVSDQERVQGCYVSNDELHDVVDYLRGQNECYFDDKVAKEIFVTQAQAEAAEREAQQEAEAAANKENQVDPYCKRALKYWLERNAGKASIASIQRNLGIGFNRAGRIVAQLQQLHYIEEPAPSESGSKPLKVLVTLDQLDDLFPDLQD